MFLKQSLLVKMPVVTVSCHGGEYNIIHCRVVVLPASFDKVLANVLPYGNRQIADASLAYYFEIGDFHAQNQ